jgi:hypothetical protein
MRMTRTLSAASGRPRQSRPGFHTLAHIYTHWHTHTHTHTAYRSAHTDAQTDIVHRRTKTSWHKKRHIRVMAPASPIPSPYSHHALRPQHIRSHRPTIQPLPRPGPATPTHPPRDAQTASPPPCRRSAEGVTSLRDREREICVQRGSTCSLGPCNALRRRLNNGRDSAATAGGFV